MKKIIHGTLAVILTAAIHAAAAPSAPSALLRDGFVIRAADGIITNSPDSDLWLFLPDSDISDSKGVLKAGQPVSLLPSSTLEQITVAAAGKPFPAKITATVTAYRGKNYLFCTSYLPLRAVENTPPANAPQTTAPQPAPADPNSLSILPSEVLQTLSQQPTVDLSKQKQLAAVEPDRIMLPRTGYIRKNIPYPLFQIDSIGWNIDSTSYTILPCRTLESAEDSIAAFTYQQRFSTTGTLTKYKDAYYLLPNHIIPKYSHGNFNR